MAPEHDRTRLEARPLRLILLGAIAALCVVVIAFLSTEVREKLGELAYSPVDNVQWTLSQFEVDYLEFLLSAERAASLSGDAPSPARAAALEEMRKRYDILYSRFDILWHGDVYIGLLRATDVGEKLGRIGPALRGIMPLIDSSDDDLARAAPEIRDRLSAYRPVVRDALLRGNQVLVENADATRTDAALVLYRLVIASLVLLLALSLLVLMFRQVAALNERRAKQVLTTSARLETIFSTSRDAILVFDRMGRIETANAAASEMFGEAPGALAGRRVGEHLSREAEGRPVPLMAGDLSRLCGQPDDGALRLIGQRDGVTFPVEVSMNVTDREGASVFVCVIRDISHQVAAEAELKDSRDRALAGERAKARFLGVVSHEMRTPLNGILGTTELMQDAPETELRDHYLPVLRNSSKVLLDLVNDVLEITRIEGRVAVERSAFDLDALIATVIDAERPRARANGNRLSRQKEPPVGTVLGDGRRLRQILLNLVANAAKFTREGEIGVAAERLPDGRVEIQVADSGIGIAEEDVEAIFDDFVRTDRAVALQIQGTGLGLGIARQLARTMGGEITVESIEGEGSLFRITLPLPAVATPVPEPPAPRPVATAPSARQLDILLVEDNATNRFVTRRMLKRQGHAVAEAHDGAEAVEAARARSYDLILMDVSMPRMDGIEATRLIREAPGPNRTTTIIALTAHIGEEVSTSLLKVGMDRILAKPLTRADLEEVIAATLRLTTDRPREVAAPAAPEDDPALPLLDQGQIAALTAASGAATVAAQIDRFLSDGAATLAHVPVAAPLEIAPALHDLAGTAAVFGARRLHAALALAEGQAIAGDAAALRQSLATCRAIWARTRSALLDLSPDPAAAAPATARAMR